MEQLLLHLNASLTLLLGAVAWRAAPARRENQALVILCCIDGLTEVVIAALLASGWASPGRHVLLTLLVARLLILVPGLEFAHALPFGERLPARWRWIGLAGVAVALFLSFFPLTQRIARDLAPVVFFPPFLVATLVILRRHRLRFAGRSLPRGLRIVQAVILLRWSVEMVVFAVVPRFAPHYFPAAISLDVTLLGLGTFSVLAYATLEHQLFSVRGVLAEVAILGTALVTAFFGVSGLVHLLVRDQVDPVQRHLLTAVSLLPLLLMAVGWWLRRRLGSSLLFSGGGAAARRQATLQRALRASADAVDRRELVTQSCAALAELAPGGQVRLIFNEPEPGAPLPVFEAAWLALDRYFAGAPAGYLLQHRSLGVPPELETALRSVPGDLLLPIRTEGKLRALLIWSASNGRMEREIALAAVVLAENLSAKLERSDLFERTFRLQRELEDARRLAIVGTFAAAMAHDIRTPLTSIQMNIEMLRRTVRPGSDDMESLDIALVESRRLAAYVSGVLDYVKPVAVKAVPSDLSLVAEEAAAQMALLYTGLEVRLERSYQEVPRVLIDGRRVVQVLVNLLANAAQASFPGGVVTLSTRNTQGGLVAVEVSDRGRGIDPAHVPRLFEPFFTTRPDGTGLGLAIVQKLVRAHGGEVEVSSSPADGTTFRVALPAA